MMYLYAPPSPEPTPEVSVTPSVSVSPSPTNGGKLPTTGPDTWGIVAVGVVLVVLGAVLVAWMRSRVARD